jgi:hypothetical protein
LKHGRSAAPKVGSEIRASSPNSFDVISEIGFALTGIFPLGEVRAAVGEPPPMAMFQYFKPGER